MRYITIAGLSLLSFLGSCAATRSGPGVHAPPQIASMMASYVDLWSRGDVARIVEEAYSVPFTIIRADGTTTFEDEQALSEFLTDTFEQLRARGYDRSTLNGYEACRVHGDIAVAEMNFTRLLKDGSVMGSPERTVTYVLRRTPSGFRIAGLVPHTEVAR